MATVEPFITLVFFALYVALLTVCLKRRSRGSFPLTAVIGPWLMVFISTLGVAEMIIGEQRFEVILQTLIPDKWAAEPSYARSSLSVWLNYSTITGLINLAGMLLFAIGIFTLARRRTRAAVAAQQVLPETP
ncbi:hypothetical protein [Haloferula rosea]|uniref:Uncharacterized protein n=1 Tax=Haloferula rosea TaxID=490093 RepID=A0A934RGS4_9BACT|nr:hypothetical protein [Haloferula rosea]MBK1828246.1 hypothetical protein [Haloferula rosea]